MKRRLTSIGGRGGEEREERGEGGGISYSVRDEHVSPKSREGWSGGSAASAAGLEWRDSLIRV